MTLTKYTLTKDYFKKIKEYYRKLTLFYSNQGKNERERISVEVFLSLLGINYSKVDVISIEEQNNPVDVQYKECRFQIKEIPDDVKRHRDIKQTYEALEKADKDKIDWPISVYDKSPYQTAWERVTNKLEQIEKSYSNEVKSGLDLLFYITNTSTELFNINDFTRVKELEKYGFRSVSAVICDRQAVILFVTDHSPPELKTHFGKLYFSL
ncbi:TPA: hypothetical protein JBH76_04945 [Legionella pneumophila]|nr:hypothetical protein [Legionella pneumophila]HAU0969536.1 hypothetical protein [Legionella pneumophila]HAU1767711.1 hypothetical protein [Legionella pneumophila]HAU2317674.1 hypothetical protein [Legionella pneumophila]